jgi:hypothetical protein
MRNPLRGISDWQFTECHADHEIAEKSSKTVSLGEPLFATAADHIEVAARTLHPRVPRVPCHGRVAGVRFWLVNGGFKSCEDNSMLRFAKDRAPLKNKEICN